MTINSLEQSRQRLVQTLDRDIDAMRSPPTLIRAQTLLAEHFYEILKSIKQAFGPTDIEPDSLFLKGHEALEKLEAFRFVLDNLLEAVKKGCSLQDTMGHYADLGLLDGLPPLAADTHNSPWASNAGAGRFITWVGKKLKNAALALMEIMTNALKASPKWFSLKPSIGFTAAFPTFMLEIDGESVSLRDLFNQLRGGPE